MNFFERAADRFLGNVVKRGVLEIVHADRSVSRFGKPEAGFPEVRMRFGDGNVARGIVLDPGLGAAEAFMDGRLILEQGDILALLELVRANSPWDRGANLGTPSLARRLRGFVSARKDSYNEARSAKANVAHHYDLGNDFYRLFLDARMQYSCGYWPRAEMTLDQAQEAKLAHIAAKLRLAPDHHVLDIGCGWGGLAIYLAQTSSVRVTGITLSEEQLVFARNEAVAAGVADRVRFELVDYRDLAARGARFDRIVSVGMFEHVGRPQFPAFFRACATMLADHGVMMLHTIGRMNEPGATDAFTRKYIFPGGYIPALSETIAASEPVRLIASDVEMLRLHYAFTLRAWYANCARHQAEIEAMYDTRFFRMWQFYLAGAATAFENSGLCNYQIIYLRDRHATPITRDWIAAAESELPGA